MAWRNRIAITNDEHARRFADYPTRRQATEWTGWLHFLYQGFYCFRAAIFLFFGRRSEKDL
ncbi:hypothetical protein NB231_13981 [Nitrococcus mobilis Nb-231]|uniref:Uncharacterized protein n=1 Tax=Nitrococcus mobilis Nb-231 TaxID=314278 RepID=A4BV22_9GAMM|nr:hypothetical protein NB231_13981 [Nitrococcus mobilis Nb-231]